MDISLPNEELGNHLQEIAYYYKISHDTYRSKVFTEAAQKIEIYPELIISGIDAKNKIGYGIGESIISDIDEYLNTGTSQRLENLKNNFSDRKQVLDLFMSLHGVGPVTANRLYEKGFRTLDDIYYGADLTETQKISIYYREHLKLRIPREEMTFINTSLHQLLPNLEIVMVGSYRREEPDSGDMDILIKQSGTVDLNTIVNTLKDRNLLVADFAQGNSKYLGLLQLPDRPVRRIDILIINPESWATALLYFTGSQRFNILMRKRAKDLGYRLNEYGLYKVDNTEVKERVTDRYSTEQTVFNYLQLKYLSPKERTRDLNSLETLL
jgi:DNA polymerase/3'-5' exonuclease PolX